MRRREGKGTQKLFSVHMYPLFGLADPKIMVTTRVIIAQPELQM